MKILASIIGLDGKMGKEIQKYSSKSPIEIIGGVGKDDMHNLKKILKKSHIAIDFSSPKALDNILYYATKTQTPLVIGTTGYSEDDFTKIKKASKKLAILYSSNFSLGIALLRSLATHTSKVLDKSFIDIVEKHHILKKDKPSGTALTLAQDIKDNIKNDINIHSIRAANIVGEHSICFTNDEEIIEIRHVANSRSVFAKGALRAAKFIHGKKTGLYSINDLFGESDERS